MQTNPSDEINEEIIKLAKAGDESAISKIVTKYQSYLLYVANKQIEPAIASRAAPSDVVQDTLAQVYQKIGFFRGKTELELKAWLRTSLSNALKNNRRYHFRDKRSITNEVELNSNDCNDSSTPSKKLQLEERLSAVKEGLEQLSESDQGILRLRHEQGLTFTEIAEFRDVSPDAARMAWGRALERLKKHIQKRGEV